MTFPGQPPNPPQWQPPIPPPGQPAAVPPDAAGGVVSAGAMGPPPFGPPPPYPPGFVPPRKSPSGAVIAAVIVGAVLVLGAVVGGVALLIPGSDSGSSSSDDESFVEPDAVTRGYGIVEGSGSVVVELYVDFSCPACAEFEADNGELIAKAVDDNEITLITYPMAMLDGYSSTKYSTRSAAASVCAADEGRFRDYAQALFTDQPEEGGKGLSDTELTDRGSGIGLGDSFADCLNARTYEPWVAEGTDKAAGQGINSVPVVEIDGTPVQDRARFADMLAEALDR